MLDESNSLTFQAPVAESVITDSRTTPTLLDAAREIWVLANHETDLTLQAALKAAQLKRRLLAGEAGEFVKWRVWMMHHIGISRSHLYELVKIGSASDPIVALERYRRDNRERSKKRVETAGSEAEHELSRNHKLMLKLVRKLSDTEAEEEYRRLWQLYGYRIA